MKGLVVSSNFKKQILNPNFINQFRLIGIAHNQIEYFIKCKQGCSLIMLSPLFLNRKFSINKILGPTKFKLIAANWKTNICGLGGVNFDNINKLKLIKLNAIGFSSLIKNQKIKKPVNFLKLTGF